jgi:polysaccharide biosynthesis protein PslH
MRILLLTYGIPWPLDSGARIRDFHLIRELSKAAEIHLWCFAKDEGSISDLRALRAVCCGLEIYRPAARSIFESLTAAASALRFGRPLATSPFYYADLEATLRHFANQKQIDVFQIEHSFLAPYVSAAPRGCRTVLSMHNVGWLQYARIAHLYTGIRRPLFAMKAGLMSGWEARIAGCFQHTIAVSEAEASLLRSANADLDVTVIENGVDCDALHPLPPAAHSNHILFVGVLGYPPNADAVLFFARRVLPLIRRHVPGVRFSVVGKAPPREVVALASSGVFTLHADVPDVLPYYTEASVCVAPLRAAGGTRLKILEAMALGRPTVSTTIGAEGLELQNGAELLIADSADDFAACVVRLLRDSALWREIARNARRRVETRHNWSALGAKQLALCASPVNNTADRPG